MSAPPSHPKQRRWQPPLIGDYFVRKTDGSVAQVKDAFVAEREVLLVACINGQRMRVGAGDLERDWRKA
jgi:hypothetical protein